MSLAINIDKVAEVLLPDTEWHKVADDSFEIDSYEFTGEGGSLDDMRLTAGLEKQLIPVSGATWKEPNGVVLFCPLTSVLAVRYKNV